MIKSLTKAVGAGAALVVGLGILTVATYNQPLALLLWPGFLLMNYIYRSLGFQGIGNTNFGWLFWPGVLIDVLLYAALYTLFRETSRKLKQRRVRSTD